MSLLFNKPASELSSCNETLNVTASITTVKSFIVEDPGVIFRMNDKGTVFGRFAEDFKVVLSSLVTSSKFQ
jgi:hypothetical protein